MTKLKMAKLFVTLIQRTYYLSELFEYIYLLLLLASKVMIELA